MASEGGVLTGRTASLASVRRGRAGVIIGAMLVGILAMGALSTPVHPGVAQEAFTSVFAESDLSGFGNDADEEQERQAAASCAVPQGFEDEVVGVAGRADVRVLEGCGIVGFVESGNAESVFDGLLGDLSSKGWLQIESGRAACGTFVKEDGFYRWIFVTCVQVGASTSVVVQYSMADGKG